MDLALNGEQEDFARACRMLVERHWLPASVGPVPAGHSDALWRAMASAGWLGVPFSEEHGGGGATLFELGIAYREAGRSLVPTTLASTMFAALLIERLGRAEQAAAWLPRITGGKVIGTVAFAEPHAHYRADALTTIAHWRSGMWHLSGEKAFVPNAACVDLMLVAARAADPATGEEIAWFAVAPDSVGVELVAHRTFAGDAQHLVRLSDVQLPSTALLGERRAIARSLQGYEEVVDAVTALQCMEMVGGAEKVLELTCEHVRRREQFGQPIGTFQAVQHIIADLASRIRAGCLAALRALWLVARGQPASREVSIAKAWLSRAYVDATVWAHQLHGGIGYARETGLYRWSERAKLSEVQNGDVEYHLDRIADGILVRRPEM